MKLNDEMYELGRFFIVNLGFDGSDPLTDYILKKGGSIKQKAESKLELMKCLNLAKKLKANEADREELVRICKYAYLILQTEEYVIDVKRARTDFRIDELRSKYSAA